MDLIKKTVRIPKEKSYLLDFLTKELNCSENTVFLLALIKFYKEIK